MPPFVRSRAWQPGRPHTFGQALDECGRSCPRRLILPVEGALPIISEGPEPDVLPGFVAQLVPMVAPTSLGVPTLSQPQALQTALAAGVSRVSTKASISTGVVL